MSKTEKPSLSAAELTRYKEILGPPPVLTSENPEHFDAIFDQILASIGPRDFIAFTCLWHYICAEWMIRRYTRHATLSIERRHQEQLKALAENEKQRIARKESAIRQDADRRMQSPPDIANLLDLERRDEMTTAELEERMQRSDIEIAQNRCLEASIMIQEQLNKLIASQVVIRNDALQQLEIYEAGLGRRAEAATYQTLDAEYSEVSSLEVQAATPSLIPPESNNELDPENRSEPAQ